MLNEFIEEIIAEPDRVTRLTRDETRKLLDKAEHVISSDPSLIEIDENRKIVFIGDTHGDFDAVKAAVKRYFTGEAKLIFLGDYVDRGQDSLSNINYLLSLKVTYPEMIILLQGNHEGYAALRFYPANFWESLDSEMSVVYGNVLGSLPLAISAPGLIALHGALPDVKAIGDINGISLGSAQWRQTVWGDWQESPGKALATDAFTGRPQFGRDYFKIVMERFGKNVLVRSHQPGAPPVMFDKRCLTIFTSHAYMPLRRVAITNVKKEIQTTDDFVIEEI